MCYFNNIICELNVVAIIYFILSITKRNSVPDFVFFVSVQLRYGNHLRAWFLAITMEASCMFIIQNIP